MNRLTLVLALAACDVPRGTEGGGIRWAVDDLDIFVNGFHKASGDPSHQEEVDHFCNTLSGGVIQCVLYRDERMVGIEHIVPRERFDALPLEERAFWHPHNYEVVSGLLVTPGQGSLQEHDVAEDLVGTYGKTWHVWQPEDDLPVGVPVLMKAFIADGEIDPALVDDRDQRFGIDTTAIRESRRDIEDPGADPATLAEPEVCVCESTPF